MAEHENGENKVDIIMKVDSPDEDTDKNENEEERELETSKICSPGYNTIFSPSRHLKFNPFAKKFSNPLENNQSGNKPIIKPSIMGQPSKGFTLKPSKLEPKVSAVSENRHSITTNHINGETPTPVFVPLVVSNNKTTEVIKPRTSTVAEVETSHGFVFGQNLQERVITEPSEDAKPSTSTSVSSNGTNEMLFSSAAKESSENKSLNSTEENKKSLSESAREYQERKSNKRKYEEVEVVTGEEGEANILHFCCKLFTYDTKLGNWQERGRGTIRLNDYQIKENDQVCTQSRLVFRTSGALKVILNTKIWADMTVECASPKSIRFTAVDKSGDVKVYLAMANGDEIKQLYENIKSRLSREQKRQKKLVTEESSEEIKTQ